MSAVHSSRRLGRAVKEVRIRRGLTQRQASAASGLAASYISDIERGARNPGWDAVARLATGLGVRVDEIARSYDEHAP